MGQGFFSAEGSVGGLEGLVVPRGFEGALGVAGWDVQKAGSPSVKFLGTGAWSFKEKNC